jgi:hypothetical protein
LHALNLKGDVVQASAMLPQLIVPGARFADRFDQLNVNLTLWKNASLARAVERSPSYSV